MSGGMKELVLFLVVGLASLFILGYSVHMLIGGLVSETTEWITITIACVIGTLVVSYMTWDIIKKRRAQ